VSFEIKICGITNVADARAAQALGVDYLGFVLYPGSPRAVTAEQVASILSELDQPCKAVGVFVNRPRPAVEAVAEQCGLWAVQVHGDETAAAFTGTSLRIWRALKMEPEGVVPEPAAWRADRYIVDSAVTGAYGGTGVTADWAAAHEVAQAYPVLLAGGLKPQNVAAAIRAVSPRGVDVSSGIELRPGKKDLAMMELFVERVRQTVARGEKT